MARSSSGASASLWIQKATSGDIGVTAVANNPLSIQQEYIDNPNGIDLNVLPVFVDYTGAGIAVAIADESIDASHPDLAAQYDAAIDFDFHDQDDDATLDGSDRHATGVAGVIAAADDTAGIIGVAHGATIAGLRVLSRDDNSVLGSVQTVRAALEAGAGFDIVNNSYTYDPFDDSFGFHQSSGFEAALASGAASGRGGLGTVFVFAVGNSRGDGGHTAETNLQSSRHTIAVASTDSSGVIASTSTPGSAVLVSAQGVGVYTTDVAGSGGYRSGDFATLNGTSFAAPMVSGVAALMLEANPGLGFRDVQQILALSARNTDPSGTSFQQTDAHGVNGGGLHYSHDYGFGYIDATAAVRLAETWKTVSTAANEQVITIEGLDEIALPIGTASGSVSFEVGQDLRLQHIELDARLKHASIDEVSLRLISPNGTISEIFNTAFDTQTPTSGYVFRLDTVAHLLENARGTWTLEAIDDRPQTASGRLIDTTVRFYGDPLGDDDLYIYTDEFSLYASQPGRTTLTDQAGNDTINAAAVSSASTVNLDSGSLIIAGVAATIEAATVIEGVFTGDGNDSLTGNAVANALHGGRGNDTIIGGGGFDSLTGGPGDDLLSGGFGIDTAMFQAASTDYTITAIADGKLSVVHGDTAGLTPGRIDGSDTLDGIEWLSFADVNIDAATYDDPPSPFEGLSLIGANKVADELIGGDGNDTLRGLTGIDYHDGGGGNDTVDVSHTQMFAIIDLTAGTIFYGHGQVEVAINIENVIATEGDNEIVGTSGDNVIDGRGGDDVVFYGGPSTDYDVSEVNGVTTVTGPDGTDTLINVERIEFDTDQEPPPPATPTEDLVLIGVDRWADRLVGGTGNDYLAGLTGIDYHDGGDGNDTVDVSHSAARATIDLAAGTIVYSHGASEVAINIENVIATDGNNEIWGTAGDNVIDGRGGNDVVFYSFGQSYYTLSEADGVTTVQGPEGTDRLTNVERIEFGDDLQWPEYDALLIGSNSTADELIGGPGNDYLQGLRGIDTHDGGEGSDTIDVSHTASRADIDLAAGTVTFGTFAVEVALNIENVIATNGTNRIVGTAGTNFIDGQDGVDTVVYAFARELYDISAPQGPDQRLSVAGPEGTDWLFNVERLEFADANLSVSDDLLLG